MAAEVRALHTSITGQLLPRSDQVHNHIESFLKQEILDLQKINRDNDKIVDQMKGKLDEYNNLVGEVKGKKAKDMNFMEKGSGFLKAKEEEIKSKNKNIEAISTGLKQSVTKVKPEKLSKLPVDKQPALKDFFQTTYTVLYNDSKANFKWDFFKEKALEHQNGQDFISRLVNINFKDLKVQNYNELLRIKNDPKFDDICVNSKYALDMIDIADWLEYVCMGHQLSEEKKASEKDYEKIRKDILKRKDGALQMSEEFWTTSYEQLDNYQSNLMNIQSQIRTMLVGMNKSVGELNEVKQKRVDKIKQTNAI